MLNDIKIIKKPGYLGSKREETHLEWDKKYDNWLLVWKVNDFYISKEAAYMLYEDSYYHYLNNNKEILSDLTLRAKNVYDDSPTNVNSKLDYLKQETNRTHLQDIAIRRSIIRLGKKFRGKELIQIRDSLGIDKLSMTLSPGQVPFHMPELILKDHIEGYKSNNESNWWLKNSVEDFYQSNKFLAVKTN